MIEIDPDVFTYDEDLDYSKETFVVTGDFAPEVVLAALDRVSERFMTVDENGVEHDPSRMDEVYLADLYTPNYVSDPQVTSRGIQVYVDCKGVVPDPMTLTLHRVLREELGAAGVEARIKAVSHQ
ncbi:MAG TPA: hypothetical protein VFJ12_04810 [Segeticoccus sp.]|jgi:hypothetical protein|nr:hypothetical protein [Segeticoccus sp.]